MAEKTVSVRLKAVVDDYKRAMGEAGKATQSVAKADAFKRLGQSTADLGDRLTRNVTLPIVGIGIAATKMSMDFDSTFVKMQSLAGATADEIDGMKKGVLDLAGETGKAPQELAEALYFLRSSGLDASAAMDALEMSAKASAAGMGSTVDIADAVSSAMNGYAKSGLTAAEATDVLVATAKEGKAEPAELAKQMGGLIPVASELGITFQDVGASLAALSLSGNNAAAASTLLGNLMAKILKPSQQGAEALAAVGISYEDLRKLFAKGDMLGALETLRASLGDVGFSKFLEDKQAIDAGLALTGENVEKNREIFDALGESVGATDKAFATWAESMGAKNAKAWAQFQTAMIRLGDTLAPIATDIIGFASKALEAFDKLPDPIKRAAAGLVIIAAAAGPLMSVGGRLISIWASMAKVFANLSDRIGNNFGQAMADALNQGAGATDGVSKKMGGLQKAAGFAAGAAGVGAVLFAIHEIGAARKAAQIDKLVEDFMATGEAAEEMAAAADGSKVAMGDLAKVFSQLLDTDLAAADRFLDTAEAAGIEEQFISNAREALERKADASRQAAEDTEANTRVTEEGAAAFDEETTAVNATVDALSEYADTLKAQFDPLFGVLNASNGVRDARLGVEEATRKLTEAEKEHGKGSEEAATAARDLADAHDDAVVAALDLEVAQVGLAAAVESGAVSVDDAKATMARWVEQGHITQAEADVTAAKFAFMTAGVEDQTAALGRIPRSVSTEVRTPNAVQAREAIDILRRKFEALDGRVYSVRFKTIYETKQIGAKGGPGFVLHQGGIVPGPRGQEVAGLMLGGEEMLGLDDPRHSANLSRYDRMTSAPGGGMGNSVNVVNHNNFAGSIISSEDQAARWVASAFNRAGAQGIPLHIQGRPL